MSTTGVGQGQALKEVVILSPTTCCLRLQLILPLIGYKFTPFFHSHEGKQTLTLTTYFLEWVYSMEANS